MRSEVKIVAPAAGGDAVKALSIDQFFDYLESHSSRSDNARGLYAATAWLYRAVNIRASALAGIPYAVSTLAGEDAGWDTRVTPLHRLLNNIEADICLSGAAYLYKAVAFGGTPQAELADVERLNPWTMTPLTKPEPSAGLTEASRGVYGFRQVISGQKPRYYSLQDVVYFDHLYNPSDDVGPGVAPADVAGVPSAITRHMNEYASGFFANGSVIPFVLKTDKAVTPDEQDRLRSMFRRLYQGVRQFFQVPLLQRGLSIEKLGTAPSDLAMPELEDSAKKQIAAAIGIPPGLLEQQDTSHATAKTHQLSFYTETILPEAAMLEEKLNEHLFAPIGLDFAFRTDELEVLQQNELEKAGASSTLLREVRESVRADILQPWEARAILGVALERMEYPALDELEPPTAPMPEPQPEIEEPEPPAEPPDEGKKAHAPAAGPGQLPDWWSDLGQWRRKAERRNEPTDFDSAIIPGWLAAQIQAAQRSVGVRGAFLFLKQAPAAQEEIERRLRRRIEQVLDQYEDRALAAVEAGRQIDYSELFDDLRGILAPEVQAIMTTRALELASEVGIAFDPAMINVEAAEIARRYTYDLVRGLNDTTRQLLQQAQSMYIETPGMTQGDLRQILQQAFGEQRSRMIATTETTRAFSEATNQYQDRLREEGLAMRRVWHTHNDEIVCPICGPLNGKPEPDWDDKFPSGPPAHPNCRCWTELSLRKLSEHRAEARELAEQRERMLEEQANG
jgi:HK97 family phage portal protein